MEDGVTDSKNDTRSAEALGLKKPGLRQIAGAVVIVMALLFFALAFQGSRGLWERDEGRYTNIALVMLQTRNFLVPACNDDVSHFAKPPLTYWTIAGGIALLGWNERGARLPNALAFAATILVVFALARRITPDRSWLPPLIYATFLFPFVAANFITTDTLLTLWEALAVFGFVEWWHSRERSGWSSSLFLMWGGFALAFLTKGPPGLLPLLAIIVFILLAEGGGKIHRLFTVSGILVFMMVGMGWYIAIAITHPGLMTYFIYDEFVKRIGSDMHQRNPEWYKPLVIYLPVLLFGTLPWIFPMLRAARFLPRTLFSCFWWRDKLATDQWPVFLALWFFVPLMVFFFSKSRLPLYILPIFVPLSLVIGRCARFENKRCVPAYLLVAWVLVLITLKYVGSVYPYNLDSRELARAIQATIRPIPQEIVFVGGEPSWGLKLYLRSEVEGVATKNAASDGTSSEELFASELIEKEPEKLFIVDRRKRDWVIDACRQAGFDIQIHGTYGSWIFFTPQPRVQRDL